MSSNCNNDIKNSVSLNNTNKIDAQLKMCKAGAVFSSVQKDDITSKKSKKQLCRSQLNKDCFHQFSAESTSSAITEQEKSLINLTKNMQDKSTLCSISEDIHNKEITTNFNDNNDCNNNLKKTPKCTISEDITFNKPKYIVLKTPLTKTDHKKDGQETLTSPEKKRPKLSNTDNNVLYSNLLSCSK